MQKAYKSVAVLVCKNCNGEGKLWLMASLPTHGSDDGDGKFIKCQICKGSGMVKATKETTVTIEPHVIKPFIN